MQEIRRFKPSTVSHRFSVTAGFYRTCALDGIIDHSPAERQRNSARCWWRNPATGRGGRPVIWPKVPVV